MNARQDIPPAIWVATAKAQKNRADLRNFSGQKPLNWWIP
jgi:hypothetical protein